MIVKINPWYDYDEGLDDIFQLRRNIDSLFDSIFGREKGYSASSYPSIDMIDTGESLVLHSELPGFKKENIRISIKDDVLNISGKRESTETPENVNWLRQERFHGDFSRSLRLPYGVDAEKVKAEFKNGILKIILPKKKELKPKEIVVK